MQGRIVDRYVFVVYFRVFIICNLCLTGIYLVGDFVENLAEFLDAGQHHGGLPLTLVKYYSARVPWFFDMMGRVASLVAGVFAITWLQRNNEMTALMAAGISRWRVIQPIVWGAVAISGFSVVNRELIIPHFRDELSQSIREWGGDHGSPMSPQYDYLTDILLDGEEVVPRERRIVKPVFRLPISMSYFAMQLTAETAERMEASPEHPSGYLLTHVNEPANIDTLDAVHLDGRPIVYTRANAPWLQPQQCFVVSYVTFGQLLGGKSWRQFASTPDLIAGLNNPSMNFGADVRVSVHARMIQPLLDITLFFLGIPTVMARESRNLFVAAGSCVLIVVTYFLIVLTSHSLGFNYIVSPVQAAWAPAMIMVPWAFLRSAPLRR